MNSQEQKINSLEKTLSQTREQLAKSKKENSKLKRKESTQNFDSGFKPRQTFNTNPQVRNYQTYRNPNMSYFRNINRGAFNNIRPQNPRNYNSAPYRPPFYNNMNNTYRDVYCTLCKMKNHSAPFCRNTPNYNRQFRNSPYIQKNAN